MTKRISKSLVANGETIVSEADWNAELEAKHQKLVEWLRAQRLEGVLIRRHENIAWLTGGAVEVRVLTPGETGVASLLVTAQGKRYYFTTENEAPRLHDEEFGTTRFRASSVSLVRRRYQGGCAAIGRSRTRFRHARARTDSRQSLSPPRSPERDRDCPLSLARGRDRGGNCRVATPG